MRFDAIESLYTALSRFVGADRLYTLSLSGTDGRTEDWAVERWCGWEQLSAGFAWRIDVLSTDADLPLGTFIGQRATLRTQRADGGHVERSGLVNEMQRVGAEGGLARYRLSLVPWTWLLGQGRRSRVFQDKTVREIVEAVFAAYAPLATWQWGDEVGPFLQNARARSYCVQYRETDESFVQRLLAEEGLGWRLEEAGDTVAGHRMVLFAHSGEAPQEFSAAREGGIRFHRSDATETRDSVQAFGKTHQLGAGTLTVLSSDYKAVSGHAATAAFREQGTHDTPLDLYDYVGAYAFAGRAEAERYAGLLVEAHEANEAHWLGQGTVRTFRVGTWFNLTDAPAQFDAPPAEALLVRVQHVGVNNLPATLREQIDQALGPARDLAVDMPEVSQVSWDQVRERAQAVGYANVFTALAREQPWRPVLWDGTGAVLNPRATAPGYQTAVVVGQDAAAQPQGAHELHTDALGRIRVRFHFQDECGESESRDSCWLRVAQRYAGPGVGTQFLPRIGQEVLIGFLGNDIDRPLVMGALYNGQGEAGIAASPGTASQPGDASAYAQARDHATSAQANATGGHAPAWHGMSGDAAGHRNAAALSGIKSKEFGGGGHNRLVFDDSDEQLRLQLATTHAATELTLGHLIHQADNYRGSFRGEGYELRTDQWGAVRGEAGLWVSAYGSSGESPAGDAVAATALLKQAGQLGEVFSQAAGTHKTVKVAAHEGVTQAKQSQLIPEQAPLPALLTSAKTVVRGNDFEIGYGEAGQRKNAVAEGHVPHSGDALLGLAAPAGTGYVAGQSLQWTAGETLTLASGQSTNAAIAKDLRIHTGQAIGWLANAVEGSGGDATALSLVTGEGEFELTAQHDEVKLQSKDGLKLVSSNAQVELAAGKAVHLATAGGASVTIEGGNIVINCPGMITVHAAKKSFVGPVQRRYPLPQFPRSSCKSCLLDAARQGTPGVIV